MSIEPFRLERYFAEHEFTVPFQLSCSDCETMTIAELLSLEDGARGKFENIPLGYTDSQGSMELRTEIAALYDTIAPDQVIVHTGAEEAIFVFMNAVCDSGDHIIVHRPCYQSLYEVARSAGCEVTFWEACEGNGWRLDVDFLAEKIRTDTKAVVFNSPHNPTGYHMDAAALHEIGRLSKERGFFVFSDEVYRFLEYCDEERLPAFCDIDDRAVSLGVLSKSFGLAGLRIGWIATRNRNVLDAVSAYKDYTTICNSAPSEFLAALALRNRDKILERTRNIVLDNLKRLEVFIGDHSDVFFWVPPKAGPVAFPRLRTGESTETFCRRLREKKGVLLLPGNVFGDEYSDHVRIGFGRRNLDECLGRLGDFLAGK